MTFPNPWVLVAIMLALAGAGYGGYTKGHEAGKNSVEAQQALDERVAAVAGEAAASAAAGAISKITVRHQTVRQEVQREIIEKPVYRNPDCRTGADSLQRFNSTIAAEDRPVPDPGKLPPADSSNR